MTHGDDKCKDLITSLPVLLRDAEELEWKDLISPNQSRTLDGLFHSVYAIHLPKPSHYHFRRELVHLFNTMAKETFGGSSTDFPAVKEFGSYLMDLFSIESDLDLSINFRKTSVVFSRNKKQRVLRRFVKRLYKLQAKKQVLNVQMIMSARVPILKFTDCKTGIDCDLSVENRDGIERSEIIRIVLSIDERFKKLAFLMKTWAKAHDINSSRDRTLNSLSIISLVAFHLQTRFPPILPPFSALLGDGDLASVQRIAQGFVNYGNDNKESLAELFVALLAKLESVKTLWLKGLCASTYNGSWIYKTWASRIGFLSVEDFYTRSENVARAVETTGVKKIYECIYHSLSKFTAFKDGLINGLELVECLFGKNPVGPSQNEEVPKTSINNAVDVTVPPNSSQTKTKKNRKLQAPNSKEPPAKKIQFLEGSRNFKSNAADGLPAPLSSSSQTQTMGKDPVDHSQKEAAAKTSINHAADVTVPPNSSPTQTKKKRMLQAPLNSKKPPVKKRVQFPQVSRNFQSNAADGWSAPLSSSSQTQEMWKTPAPAEGARSLTSNGGYGWPVPPSSYSQIQSMWKMWAHPDSTHSLSMEFPEGSRSFMSNGWLVPPSSSLQTQPMWWTMWAPSNSDQPHCKEMMHVPRHVHPSPSGSSFLPDGARNFTSHARDGWLVPTCSSSQTQAMSNIWVSAEGARSFKNSAAVGWAVPRPQVRADHSHLGASSFTDLRMPASGPWHVHQGLMASRAGDHWLPPYPAQQVFGSGNLGQSPWGGFNHVPRGAPGELGHGHP